jgi:hypothetical protein
MKVKISVAQSSLYGPNLACDRRAVNTNEINKFMRDGREASLLPHKRSNFSLYRDDDVTEI